VLTTILPQLKSLSRRSWSRLAQGYIQPNLVSLIPYHSGLDTLYFTCSAVLIILPRRMTEIKITRSGFFG
jgi:hypothetical protein